MDDLHAHFLSIVVDIYLGTALGSLMVEIETLDGAHITGTPAADIGHSGSRVDGINPESTIRIGRQEIRLGDIAACRVRAPTTTAEA